MISLKGMMKTMDWNGKQVELGKVYSNPYANSFKSLKEAEGEDHEVSMAQNSLDTIIKMATELKAKMGETEKDIPAWIQDHITNAENFISQASSNYHEYGTNESVTEGSHGMATKLLQSIVSGDSSRAEGTKMSKELAQHYIDWIRTSPFGKKNGNLPLDMLVKASFNWGIERGLDSKLKGELSKLKSTIK